LQTLALPLTTCDAPKVSARLAETPWGAVRPRGLEIPAVPLQATAQLVNALSAEPSPRRAEDAALRALAFKVQGGDLRAFDQLYHLTREDVARTLAHLVGRRLDLEDLIQDVYLRLLTAVKSFRGEAQFRTFLYRICTNVAVSQLRWWRRRPEETVSEVPEQPSEAPGPEGAAEVRQAARLVEAALAKLTPKKRFVFVYHELCGMAPEEIAEAMGTNANTVRSRLHHARQEFGEAMKRLLLARKGGADGRP